MLIVHAQWRLTNSTSQSDILLKFSRRLFQPINLTTLQINVAPQFFLINLMAHICPESGRRDVIERPIDRKFCEKQCSSRQFDVDTHDRDVKINRRVTFIR